MEVKKKKRLKMLPNKRWPTKQYNSQQCLSLNWSFSIITGYCRNHWCRLSGIWGLNIVMNQYKFIYLSSCILAKWMCSRILGISPQQPLPRDPEIKIFFSFRYVCMCVCMVLCVRVTCMCIHLVVQGWCHVFSSIAFPLLFYWGEFSYWIQSL